MDFEWDPEKADSNSAKHRVTFQEAATVFGDPLAVTYVDPDHSEDEDRYLTFGLSSDRVPLIVAHTGRDNTLRIISARRMNRRERKAHEEGQDRGE